MEKTIKILARTAKGSEIFHRAGLRFTKNPLVYEVTPEQLKRLNAEKYVWVQDKNFSGQIEEPKPAVQEGVIPELAGEAGNSANMTPQADDGGQGPESKGDTGEGKKAQGDMGLGALNVEALRSIARKEGVPGQVSKMNKEILIENIIAIKKGGK